MVERAGFVLFCESKLRTEISVWRYQRLKSDQITNAYDSIVQKSIRHIRFEDRDSNRINHSVRTNILLAMVKRNQYRRKQHWVYILTLVCITSPALVAAFSRLTSVGLKLRFSPQISLPREPFVFENPPSLTSISLASSSSNREGDPASSDGTIQTFLEHMFRDRGCQGEPDDVTVWFDEATGRRGLYVTSEDGIAEGDYVFAIPVASAWVVEKTEANAESGSNELSDAEKGLLFWKWLQSSGKSNSDQKYDWKPYREILPTREESFDPTPDFWSEEQISELELPQAVDGAFSRKKSVQALAKQEDMNEGELSFATWLVASRAITVVDDNVEDSDDDDVEDDVEDGDDDFYFDSLATTCVLVPLLDMINHSSESANAYFAVLGDDGDDEENLYYAVVADRDLCKGEELLISYGSEQDSSVDLLLQYGFVPESNPYDVEFWDAFSEESQGKHDFSWSTTLQEDEDRLTNLDEDDGSATERTILEFRIRMKRAYEEWKELSA